VTDREQQLEDGLRLMITHAIGNYIEYCLYSGDIVNRKDSAEHMLGTAKYIAQRAEMLPFFDSEFNRAVEHLYWWQEYFNGYDGEYCWTWIDQQIIRDNEIRTLYDDNGVAYELASIENNEHTVNVRRVSDGVELTLQVTEVYLEKPNHAQP
jgi:hypothetical protein